MPQEVLVTRDPASAVGRGSITLQEWKDLAEVDFELRPDPTEADCYWSTLTPGLRLSHRAGSVVAVGDLGEEALVQVEGLARLLRASLVGVDRVVAPLTALVPVGSAAAAPAHHVPVAAARPQISPAERTRLAKRTQGMQLPPAMAPGVSTEQYLRVSATRRQAAGFFPALGWNVVVNVVSVVCFAIALLLSTALATTLVSTSSGMTQGFDSTGLHGGTSALEGFESVLSADATALVSLQWALLTLYAVSVLVYLLVHVFLVRCAVRALFDPGCRAAPAVAAVVAPLLALALGRILLSPDVTAVSYDASDAGSFLLVAVLLVLASLSPTLVWWGFGRRGA